MRRSLLITSLRGYAFVIMVLGLLVPLFVYGGMRPALTGLALADLTRTAVSARSALSRDILSGDLASADSIASMLDRDTGARITVIAPDGRVVIDTQADPGSMEGHRTRTEVMAALENGTGTAIRRSATLESDMLYAAAAVERDGEPVAVVRVSVPFRHLSAVMSGVGRRTALLAAVAVALSALLAWLSSRALAVPIGRLADGFIRMKAGDFGVRTGPSRIAELDALSRGFNEAAADTEKLLSELSERNSQFQAILESASGPIAVLDSDGGFVYANAAFRALGSVEVLEGSDYRQVVAGPQLLAALGDAVSSKADGQGRMVEGGRTWAYSYTGVSGQDQVVFSLADITEMANLAAMKRDFAVNVAHELRTPLTAIKGFAETLAENARGDEAKYLGTILRNTDRLISLVRDVQTLAMLESPGAEPEFRPVDLGALAATVLDLFRPAAAAKGLELRLDTGDLPSVDGDAFRLEQVLVNLLDNAIKYTDTGSVSVTLSTRGDHAAIDVEDTGQGIPAEEIPRLCERFYVVDRSRSRSLGGTGLGLAIVKHILMLHGGSLDIRSEVGRGSVFTVLLPLPADRARS